MASRAMTVRMSDGSWSVNSLFALVSVTLLIKFAEHDVCGLLALGES
jgi:hypothetical protein